MLESVSPASHSAAPLAPRAALAFGPVLRVAIFAFLGYYAGAQLGFALTFMPMPISVLWPPNAIVLAALLLVPTSAWWVVIVAVLPAHLLSELHEGIPSGMLWSWYASNMSEALVGAALVRALLGGRPPFATLRGMVIFIASASAAAVLSSFLDSALVRLNGWGSVPYWDLWRRRTLSNITSSLVIAPLVVAWARAGWPLLRKHERAELVEGALLAAGLIGVSALGFMTDAAWVAPCAPMPFLLWAALRFGTRGATAAFATIAVAATWGAGHGLGGLASQSPMQTTSAVQLFLMSVGAVLLCLAAASEERERAILSLALLRHRLNHASRLAVMGEMAASIAHEVNQPMSAILSNVEAAQAMLAAGRLDGAEARSILQDIRDDSLRAVDIVRHIRNMARHRPPEIREFDLAQQVEAVLLLCAPLVRHRGIRIENCHETPVIVRGDPIHVQQVLANLILNAMEAMDDTPREARLVRIEGSVRDGMAQLSVRDAGHGIAPTHLEQVFDSFFTTKSSGTGLGLSISRSLIAAQGGRIWAQNNGERGATVSFTVPLAAPRVEGDRA